VIAEHVVIVGKGGVGKSTTAANLSAALAEAGWRVMLVGYDPRWNSTATLKVSNELEPVPHWNGDLPAPLYATGYKGSLCIEAGELTIEGRVSHAASLLQIPVVIDYQPEFVIHDVSWEPDHSFVMPTATEGVARLIVVTSADMAAIHVVNELFAWLNTLSAADCRFHGVAVNNLTGSFYESMISDFVNQTGTSIIARVPHSLMVSVSDFYNQTLIEAAPYSHNTFVYRNLARRLAEQTTVQRPAALDKDNLKQWVLKWQDIFTEMETGIVRDGSNI
jgi:nitrogenase iron protein NifH